MYFVFKNQILDFLDRLSALRKTPMADMKTNKLVDPAEMNGSGSPVGGIEPINIGYCIIKLDLLNIFIFYHFFTIFRNKIT